MAYFLARAREAAEPRGAACCSAQLDPNSADAMGISFDDGCFRYHDAHASLTLQLFRGSLPVAPNALVEAIGRDSLAACSRLEDPAPVRSRWACWSFVPGRKGLLVISLANTADLLITSLPPHRPVEPLGGQGMRAWICNELPRSSCITALSCSVLGDWIGVGQQDGAVTFFRIPASAMETEGLVDLQSHPLMHCGPVSSVALLLDALDDDEPVEVLLGASGGSDHKIVVYDLRACSPLHRIITADASPVSSLHLRLLTAGAAASGNLDHPSVALAVGGSSGTVQMWLLTASTAPELRACWQHNSGGAILELAFDGAAEKLLSVGRPCERGERTCCSEIEIYDARAFHLLARLTASRFSTAGSAPTKTREEKLLSAESKHALLTGADVTFQLLLCRPTGAQRLVLSPHDTVSELKKKDESQKSRSGSVQFGYEASLPVSNEPVQGLSCLGPSRALHQAWSCGSDMSSKGTSVCDLAASHHSSPGCGDGDTGLEDVPRKAVPMPLIGVDRQPEHDPRHTLAAKTKTTSRADFADAFPGRLDNPLRVLSLLKEPPGSSEPLSCLAHPALQSSAAIAHRNALETQSLRRAISGARRLSEIDDQGFVADANLSRKAMRDASSLLNTPGAETRRYERLTSLEASVPISRPAARRPEGRERALEPQLRALLTPDREPEMLSTQVGIALRELKVSLPLC